MKQIQSTLIHELIPSPRSVPGGAPLLLMLHGRGADEHDLLGLSEYLDKRPMIVSARAPFSFSYSAGYTWYDVLEVGRPEPRMFAESYTKLLRFIDDVCGHYPVDPSKIILLGFSMGSIMSFALSLTNPARFAGVIALSGYVPEESDLKFQWEQVVSPYYVAHGTYDPIIPVEFARRANILLTKTTAPVTYREFPMGHEIGAPELTEIAGWLSSLLDRLENKSR